MGSGRPLSHMHWTLEPRRVGRRSRGAASGDMQARLGRSLALPTQRGRTKRQAKNKVDFKRKALRLGDINSLRPGDPIVSSPRKTLF